MTTPVAWPAAAPFVPSRMTWGVLTSKTAWAAPYTGQTQSITHLADRLRVTVDLPPCTLAQAGEREAFFMAAASDGAWLRLHHMLRPQPLGTLRGTPTAGSGNLAGVRTLTVNTTAGATLLAGDVLGYNDQLMQCAYGGAVANGSGVMSVPLVLPLRRSIGSSSALVWSQPTATFQVLDVQPEFAYVPGGVQEGLQVSLVEVYA